MGRIPAEQVCTPAPTPPGPRTHSSTSRLNCFCRLPRNSPIICLLRPLRCSRKWATPTGVSGTKPRSMRYWTPFSGFLVRWGERQAQPWLPQPLLAGPPPWGLWVPCPGPCRTVRPRTVQTLHQAEAGTGPWTSAGLQVPGQGPSDHCPHVLHCPITPLCRSHCPAFHFQADWNPLPSTSWPALRPTNSKLPFL